MLHALQFPMVLANIDGVLAGTLAGICFMLVLGAIVVTAIRSGVAHASKEREFKHAERIKALEMGVPLDEHEQQSKYREGAFWISFWIGAAVPVAGVAAAAISITGGGIESNFAILVIWSGAAVIGASGVASAAWLMHSVGLRLGAARKASTATAAYPAH